MNQSLWRLLFTYILIIGTIYVCENVSFWLYPLGIIILANQYLVLTLLGHEGVHGLLHENRLVNRTVARYLCYFPFLMSLTHYSMNHLRHHRNLGTQDDPDVTIYQHSYASFLEWVKVSAKNILNLLLIKQFLHYYNGLTEFMKGTYPFKIKTDYFEFVIFWLVSISLIFALDIYVGFVLYWLVPLIFLLPWVRLLNSYQHYSDEGVTAGRTYTIQVKNKFVAELLFPININYHEVHHQRPDLRYYQLPEHFAKSVNSVTFADFSKKIFNSQKSKTL